MLDTTGHTNESDIYPTQVLGGFEAGEGDGELPFRKRSPEAHENRSSEEGEGGLSNVGHQGLSLWNR